MLCKNYSIVLKHILKCFDYIITEVIGFLAVYHDGVLCATYIGMETIFGQKTPFLECYVVALLFLSFLDFYCIMSKQKYVLRLLLSYEHMLQLQYTFYRINFGKKMTNLC